MGAPARYASVNGLSGHGVTRMLLEKPACSIQQLAATHAFAWPSRIVWHLVLVSPEIRRVELDPGERPLFRQPQALPVGCTRRCTSCIHSECFCPEYVPTRGQRPCLVTHILMWPEGCGFTRSDTSGLTQLWISISLPLSTGSGHLSLLASFRRLEDVVLCGPTPGVWPSHWISISLPLSTALYGSLRQRGCRQGRPALLPGDAVCLRSDDEPGAEYVAALVAADGDTLLVTPPRTFW